MRKIVVAALSTIFILAAPLPSGSSSITAVMTPESGFGWLKAESMGAAVPVGSSFALHLTWDSGAPDGGPMLAAARDAARRALIAKGYRIDPKGEYVYQMNIDMPGLFDPGHNDDQTEHPLWSDPTVALELRDQLKIPIGPVPDVLPATIAVETTVFNRRGDVMWVASIEASYHGDDPKSLLRRMVSETVAVVGTDVERDFTLTCSGSKKKSALCLG